MKQISTGYTDICGELIFVGDIISFGGNERGVVYNNKDSRVCYHLWDEDGDCSAAATISELRLGDHFDEKTGNIHHSIVGSIFDQIKK